MRKISIVCENCRYRELEDVDSGYMCVNPDSEYFGDWVEDDFSCAEFEEE